MTRALVIAIALAGCASTPEHNGVTHVYWTHKGCGVVHVEVIPPHYEEYAPGRPQ